MTTDANDTPLLETLGVQAVIVVAAALVDAVVFSIAFDWLRPWHVGDGIVMGMLVGMEFAQFATLTIWTALGPGRWWARLFAGVLSACVLSVALVSSSISDRSYVNEMLATLIGGVPIASLAALVPVWLLGFFRGHRFVCRLRNLKPAHAIEDGGSAVASATRADGRSIHNGHWQFGVSDLLAATAVAAVALGMARWAFRGAGGDEWGGIAGVCLALGLSSLAVCIPATFLATWSWSFTGTVAFSGAYGALVLAPVTIVVGTALRGQPRGEEIVTVTVFCASTMIFTAAALGWLRYVGFELRRMRQSSEYRSA